METSKDRLIKFQKYLGISMRAFESSLGMSNGSIKAADGISQNLMEKIGNVYPMCSRTWLLAGIEPMIVAPENNGRDTFGYLNIPGDVSGVVGSGTQIVSHEESAELKELRKRVRELELENARLQGKIEVLENR